MFAAPDAITLGESVVPMSRRCRSTGQHESVHVGVGRRSGRNTGGSTAAAGAGLTISGFQFSAASVTAGTEFTITNKDSAAHTVTDEGGTFDVSVPAGGTATLTIPKAGTYSIRCRIHPSMKGTITAA